jgi:hypothetical protein
MAARKHQATQQIILSLINQGLLCPLSNEKDDGMLALTKQYTWLASRCKSLNDINHSYINDDFYKYLKRLIVENELKLFTPNIIKQLQESTWAHVKKNKKM